MSQHDKRIQLSIALGIALILLTAVVFAEDKAPEQADFNDDVAERFPGMQIREISDFRQYSHDILLIVAKKMGVRLSDEVPAPLLLTDLDVTASMFNSWLGENEERFHIICSCYFPRENIIVVFGTSRLDSLAHELVHFVQVQYEHVNIGVFDMTGLELEAVEIQHWFRRNHME
ncbi:hypothetical protein QQF73_04585 [Marinobacter sp. M216]|uniref:DUF4157 domain-containing protein n=1 Tax=Marinobacter albus TaxID=3030833 RepID=A0ABT7H969_9GAMM|nr:hypothetical protein [Marinobacter sp. M216]MDK9556892.1 hypothetical protein [Marinobacter sp. M216]